MLLYTSFIYTVVYFVFSMVEASERETLVTGDEPQGTMGRVQTGGEGCLPFIRANRSVHKWYAKFRPGKFCPGIAFTVCTNQFHFPKNDREGLNPVSKMGLKKWNTNFSLEYSVRKNRTTFSDVLLLPEIFR